VKILIVRDGEFSMRPYFIFFSAHPSDIHVINACIGRSRAPFVGLAKLGSLAPNAAASRPGANRGRFGASRVSALSAVCYRLTSTIYAQTNIRASSKCSVFPDDIPMIPVSFLRLFLHRSRVRQSLRYRHDSCAKDRIVRPGPRTNCSSPKPRRIRTTARLR
jgi:hypothetical protein